MTNFAAWLDGQIAERGWSMSELARKAGYSHVTVSDVINGKSKATWEFCAAIARPLHVPAENVFREAGLLPPLKQSALRGELLEMINALSEGGIEILLPIVRGLLYQYYEFEASPEVAAQLNERGIPTRIQMLDAFKRLPHEHQIAALKRLQEEAAQYEVKQSDRVSGSGV